MGGLGEDDEGGNNPVTEHSKAVYDSGGFKVAVMAYGPVVVMVSTNER